MENMSEDEIITNANELIDNCNCYLEDDETDDETFKWFEMEKKTIQRLLDLYQKEKEKNKELKKENNEIRDWKYTIDTVEDLDLLTRLDNIKIKGKEYISKDIYSELEKDKKALIKNYDKVLSQFISKDKIKKCIQTPYPEVAVENIVELLEENNGEQM